LSVVQGAVHPCTSMIIAVYVNPARLQLARRLCPSRFT
jgi:Zn-dependent alcohol dehydrogenase